jgi:hypothetical protein
MLTQVLMRDEEVDKEIDSHPYEKCDMSPGEANPFNSYGSRQEFHERNKNHDPCGEPKGEAHKFGTRSPHAYAHQAADGCRKVLLPLQEITESTYESLVLFLS